jgi:hypothetical protein
MSPPVPWRDARDVRTRPLSLVLVLALACLAAGAAIGAASTVSTQPPPAYVSPVGHGVVSEPPVTQGPPAAPPATSGTIVPVAGDADGPSPADRSTGSSDGDDGVGVQEPAGEDRSEDRSDDRGGADDRSGTSDDRSGRGSGEEPDDPDDPDDPDEPDERDDADDPDEVDDPDHG